MICYIYFLSWLLFVRLGSLRIGMNGRSRVQIPPFVFWSWGLHQVLFAFLQNTLGWIPLLCEKFEVFPTNSYSVLFILWRHFLRRDCNVRGGVFYWENYGFIQNDWLFKCSDTCLEPWFLWKVCVLFFGCCRCWKHPTSLCCLWWKCAVLSGNLWH